jgi:hypothetical protein
MGNAPKRVRFADTVNVGSNDDESVELERLRGEIAYLYSSNNLLITEINS